MISIDERGCGQGKTTQGIYNRILYNLASDIKTMVVVPSIELQYKYRDRFPQASIINCEVVTNTTSKEISRQMTNEAQIIICTHQAFIRLHHTGLRSYYDLIIDEAIEDVIRRNHITFEGDSTLAMIHWNKRILPTPVSKKVFDVKRFDDDTWYQMLVTEIEEEERNHIINESETYRKIVDPNWDHYMRSVDYHNMINRTNTFHIMHQLKLDILDGWRDIYIASAAFRNTKMYQWLKNNKKEMRVVTKFTPHAGNVHIWTASRPNWRWSKTQADTQPEILDAYHDFVNNNATGKVITVRNNSIQNQYLSNERRVSHNVHGLNDAELISITNISCESAIIPSPLEINFIKQVWSDIHDNKFKRLVKQMYMGHLFYQVIMRCKLRSQDYNNEQINIFVLDQDTSEALAYYFDNVTAHHDNSYTPKKKVAMTSAERVKKHRAKKRNANPDKCDIKPQV